MRKLWSIQSQLVCAHWHLVVSNCVYESTEGRWSGSECSCSNLGSHLHAEKLWYRGQNMPFNWGVWKIPFGAVGQYPEWWHTLLLLFPLEVPCTNPYENDRPLFPFLNGAVNSASLLEMLRNFEGSWNRCGFRKTGLQLITPSLS